jgi:serine/threonine protein kinase
MCCGRHPEDKSICVYSEGTFDNRIFRCLVVYPAGRAIHDFDRNVPSLPAIKELLEALHDAIKAHRSLYLVDNILHRDISENNIIMTDPEKADGFKGMLIDLDLAKEVDIGRSGARHRTGTMEFMAIEVLLGYSHTYRHDLESFFYVLIWQCARRGWGKEWPKDSLLTKWYTGSYREIANAKFGNMRVKLRGLHSRTFWMNALHCLIALNPSAEPYETYSSRMRNWNPARPRKAVWAYHQSIR